jgi:hypothetical protein
MRDIRVGDKGCCYGCDHIICVIVGINGRKSELYMCEYHLKLNIDSVINSNYRVKFFDKVDESLFILDRYGRSPRVVIC